MNVHEIVQNAQRHSTTTLRDAGANVHHHDLNVPISKYTTMRRVRVYARTNQTFVLTLRYLTKTSANVAVLRISAAMTDNVSIDTNASVNVTTVVPNATLHKCTTTTRVAVSVLTCQRVAPMDRYGTVSSANADVPRS